MVMNILIPMAGKGSRFLDTHSTPKPLININGKPMITRALETLGFDGNYIFVVRNDEHINDTYQAIKRVIPNPIIVETKHVTDGASCTALLAKKHIDTLEELIIANCDQIMDYDCVSVLAQLRENYGGVVTIDDDSPKHSYARIGVDGYVTEIVEKQVVSNQALVGIHYWKFGHGFVNSAEYMIRTNQKANNEFYIGPTYNYLIEKKWKIGTVLLDKHQYIPVGTPDDLAKYLNESRKTVEP
jgi:NDP-sugar pyrophosphorylase family protein